ncbi:MAG: triose-phosphate isomerase [Endomicrobium sp.]|jgi:triosephosphate isomerase|nr:triose-phosphate isomerase [Endomicrobium sp.]
MKKFLIVGNWKMNKTISDSLEIIRSLKKTISNADGNIEIVVCPPFTALHTVNGEIKNSNINLGAQNLFWKTEGAFTGEISPLMIKDVGCTYVLIGHSERKQYFGESDNNINKKINAAFSAGLIPILCIGETLEEREKNMTFDVIKKQLTLALSNLTEKSASLVVIAYEPVWAVGTGNIATLDQIQNVHSFIKKTYSKMYKSVIRSARIIYGGSINLNNISNFVGASNVDGILVGSASLEIEVFTKIIEYFM